MERNFKGVWIPAKIWLSKDLSVVEKCLLTEIDSLSTTEKGCFASNAYLAEFLGVSVPTITRAIKKLESINIIKSETKKERDEKGKITSTRLIKMIRGSNQNDEATTNQNDEYINTSSIINKEKEDNPLFELREKAFSFLWKEHWQPNKKKIDKDPGSKQLAKESFYKYFNKAYFNKNNEEYFKQEVNAMIQLINAAFSDLNKYFNYECMHFPKFIKNRGWIND